MQHGICLYNKTKKEIVWESAMLSIAGAKRVAETTANNGALLLCNILIIEVDKAREQVFVRSYMGGELICNFVRAKRTHTMYQLEWTTIGRWYRKQTTGKTPASNRVWSTTLDNLFEHDARLRKVGDSFYAGNCEIARPAKG